MASVDDGYYDGTIKGVEIQDDEFNKPDGMIACFQVDLEPKGAVVCRHRSHGEHADKTLQMFEEIGLPSELKSFARLDETIGRRVRVYSKTSDKGRQNSYITSPRKGKVLDIDEINRRLVDADIPF